MHFLLTGSSGMLGGSIFIYFQSLGCAIDRLDREFFLSLTNTQRKEFLSSYDCVIHAASNTNVEYCESFPDECYRDNTLLTELIVNSVDRFKCKFVYISSTGVYGVKKLKDPYSEYDLVSPTTHYHLSKVLSERIVTNVSCRSLIVRAGWLFGGGVSSSKDFVINRLKEAMASNGEIYSNIEQIGSPTYVNDFIRVLYELIKNDESGIFNLVNQGQVSRYDYVLKIIEYSGMNVEVLPVKKTKFSRIANVSNNESAISLKLSQLGYKALPLWECSLEQYIKTSLSGWIDEGR